MLLFFPFYFVYLSFSFSSSSALFHLAANQVKFRSNQRCYVKTKKVFASISPTLENKQ